MALIFEGNGKEGHTLGLEGCGRILQHVSGFPGLRNQMSMTSPQPSILIPWKSSPDAKLNPALRLQHLAIAFNWSESDIFVWIPIVLQAT